jgi:hypothetical protein
MLDNRLNKSFRIILAIVGGISLITAFVLLAGWLDSPLSQVIAEMAQRRVGSNWPGYFRKGGMILLVVGITVLLSEKVIDEFNRLLKQGMAWAEMMDRWLDNKTKMLLNTPKAETSTWPLHLNRWDALIILFFVLIALVYQLATMSRGYPTVILSGDAANIASFAAGRSFPDLFKNDAILGNLNNIGLYVTVHLPLVIWLEKLVGNFGLAYSLLLFPHVFLQYFSYYLLGRVLFHNRYWAILFSVAASAPISLDGGERWGVLSDAIPRFTFQVLIPFILILLLTTWRKRQSIWPWVMVIAGLMAFIHPVSTPTWAFALWLGFWPILPSVWDSRRKIQEMFKLGGILALALLPYVSIYLTYHQSGSGNSSYDLVHYILVNYFPSNILNIPAAINTFLHNTAQFGLLWYGLAGLIFTFIVFPSERSRLKQMLVWIIGIVFVSILVPWVEISIERVFRMIPLQTELMRGMRYLVLFLFVFWFYPFAEFTRRAVHIWFTRGIFAVGTLLTLFWLILNPPQPFIDASSMFNCWQTRQFICPYNTDHADALTYIREDTPKGSKFVVFLNNRWSGIEVRYLGLRPMVYAYKDKGQLLFTNLESLKRWGYYQRLENDIFSPKKAPVLDDKLTRIVEFARDAGADYILTNFSFPPKEQLQLNVITIYHNSTYSILKSYAVYP